MQRARVPRFTAACAVACAIFIRLVSPSLAVEGAVAAGPLGGTDMRSALLPPPGLYGGIIGLASHIPRFNDGSSQPAPGLDAVNLGAKLAAPFFVYVPDFKLFDGSVGLIGVFLAGQTCGQLVSTIPRRCNTGLGDPYFELVWSRSFGQLRRSRDPGAFPIMEGLTIGLGLGAVMPIGQYNAQTQVQNGETVGNNTFDLAPTFAATYTTPPLLFEGTEFSAKLFWNNFFTNPETQYKAGTLLDIDFALTEHIGRFQVGAAGFYAFQVADDRQFGVPVAPDGRRLNFLNLGPIVNVDLAEIGAVLRVKALTTVEARNAIVGQSITVTFAKKLY